MSRRSIQLVFDPRVPMAEVEATLRLAMLAAECIHGAECVRLDARCVFDELIRAVEIDVSRRVGRTLALVFGGFIRREFGKDAVRLDRRAAKRQGLVEASA
jgi:hypothetical protein